RLKYENQEAPPQKQCLIRVSLAAQLSAFGSQLGRGLGPCLSSRTGRFTSACGHSSTHCGYFATRHSRILRVNLFIWGKLSEPVVPRRTPPAYWLTSRQSAPPLNVKASACTPAFPSI